MIHPALGWALLAALVGSEALAQGRLSAEQELRRALSGDEARVQTLFWSSGFPSRPLQMRSVSLRFEGGTPVGSSFLPRAVRVRIGTMLGGQNAVSETFGANLQGAAIPARSWSAPLPRTTVPGGSMTAPSDAWGAPDGSLRFDFPSPVEVEIPPGGALVVEWSFQGRRIPTSGAPPSLSIADGPEDLLPGISVADGFGCAALGSTDPRGPQITTVGAYQPGTDVFVESRGFRPFDQVLTLATLELLPLEIKLPTTTNCYIFLDPTSGLIVDAASADAGGAVTGRPPLPIPPAPQLCGALLYVQQVGFPVGGGGAGRPVSSNYRTVRVACPPVQAVETTTVVAAGNAEAVRGRILRGVGLNTRIE